MPITNTRRLWTAALAIGGGLAICIWSHRSLLPAILNLLDQDTNLVLKNTLFDVGGQAVTFLVLIEMVLFFLFLNLAARVTRHLINAMLLDPSHIDPHRRYVLLKTVTVAVYTLGVLVGIRVERINMTAFAILGGTLGVGIGLGLQTLMSNVVAGITLLIDQPIRIGDQIDFGDQSGEVIRVGVQTSSLRTDDNGVLTIPNSEFARKQILNWTGGRQSLRTTLSVSVPYGRSPEEVFQYMLEEAIRHPDVLKDPAPTVLISELNANGMNFLVRVWTLIHPNHLSTLRSDLYVFILRRLAEENIEIPSPRLEVRVQPTQASLHPLVSAGTGSLPETISARKSQCL